MTDDPVEIRTALALAKFWDDPGERKKEMSEYDDDYAAEAHLDRKAKEGWTRCEECGEWIHLDDVREGVQCKCGEKEDAEADEG